MKKLQVKDNLFFGLYGFNSLFKFKIWIFNKYMKSYFS